MKRSQSPLVPSLIRAELDRRREESLRSSPIEQRRQRLEQELHRYAQQMDKLLDAYQEGLLGLTELRQRMPALRKKHAAAQKELESAHWQALAEELIQPRATVLCLLPHPVEQWPLSNCDPDCQTYVPNIYGIGFGDRGGYDARPSSAVFCDFVGEARFPRSISRAPRRA
jgi:hypothetical protein